MSIAMQSVAALPQRAVPVREIVRQFTANWFTVTMGTGILALAVNQAPFVTPSLRLVAEGLWLTNIGLFAIFTALYAARWLLFPNRSTPDRPPSAGRPCVFAGAGLTNDHQGAAKALPHGAFWPC
jgi:Voltage-dependent anion channel